MKQIGLEDRSRMAKEKRQVQEQERSAGGGSFEISKDTWTPRTDEKIQAEKAFARSSEEDDLNADPNAPPIDKTCSIDFSPSLKGRLM